MSKSTIGNRIKELRAKKRLTQQQLADEINITRVTIGRVESGSGTPSLRMLSRIADALETNVDYLRGYVDDYQEINNGMQNKVMTQQLSLNQLRIASSVEETITDEERDDIIKVINIFMKHAKQSDCNETKK